MQNNDTKIALERKYAIYLKDRFFEIETSEDEVFHFVKVILRNESKKYFYPVECRVKKKVDLSPTTVLPILIDFIDGYFQEFFSEEESVFIPIDWTPYEYEGIIFEMRGQIFNLWAEEAADQILSLADSHVPEQS